MDKLLFSAIIGLVAGVIDIIPMIMQKLPRYSTVSAFFHYFFVSIIILNVDIPHISWWLEGGVVGLALTIPMLIQVGHSDKKSLANNSIQCHIIGNIGWACRTLYFSSLNPHRAM